MRQKQTANKFVKPNDKYVLFTVNRISDEGIAAMRAAWQGHSGELKIKMRAEYPYG